MKDFTKTSKGSTTRIGRGLQGTMPNRMRMLTLNVTMAGLALIITACGDDVQNRPPATTAATLTHQVTDPNVVYFVDTLYGELISHNCVNCHATNKSKNDQPFADPNNPNVAYNAAIKELVPTGQSIDPTAPAYLINLNLTDLSQNAATDFQIMLAGDGNNRPGGHHCWTASCANDANTLRDKIVDWARLVQTDGLIDDEPDDTGTNESKLVAPPDDSPRPSIVVNSDNRTEHYDAFIDYVYPVVRGGGPDSTDPRCSQCHDRNATIPATPYFADDNPVWAFDQLIDNDKVNLNNPDSSRIYLRLFQDSHNCWSVCGPSVVGDDDTMLTAINAWINDQTTQNFDSSAYNNSSALFFNDGQVTSGGARYDRWVIAKYEFTEGSGLVVNDSSGVAPLLPLTLSSANNCTWLSNYGVKFDNNCRARSQSVTQSLKLYDQIVPRGEYTIEVWIIPDNEAQEGPAVIVSYSAGSTRRNFTMGQSTEYYDIANRNSGMNINGAIFGASDQNAEPRLSTDDGNDDTHIDHVVKTNQQHLVMTYDTVTGRKIYVDGIPVLCETAEVLPPALEPCLQVRTPDNIGVVIGNILTWNPGYLFTLGSETNGANQWLGTIRMVAIHNRALTQAQIKQNFDASVGQKFNLLFAVGSRDTNGDGNNDVIGLSGVPDNSYIWFQVSQYDYFSYLFLSPKFIVLDDAYDPTTISSFSIQRMRIGLNGKEPAVGQAYSRMGPFNDKMLGLIDGSNYVKVTSIPPSTDDWTVPPTWSLSDIGTIIALENGVNNDQFFLTFELIASADPKSRQLGDPATLSVTYSSGPAYVVGMRTFNEIIASMSEVTGIDQSTLASDIKEKIAGLDMVSGLKTQLPSVETLEGFVSTQQMAISTLAGYFCSALVDGANADSFFGLSNGTLNSPVGNAFPQGPPVDNSNRDLVIDNLISRIARQQTGNEVATQPAISVIKGELETLANGVDVDGNPIGLMNSCTATLPSGVTQDCTSAARTQAIVKAMCVAVLASAAITQQ